MENTPSQPTDFAADAGLIRTVLTYCLSLVPEDAKPSSNEDETRLRVRKLLRLTDHYLFREGDSLLDHKIDEGSSPELGGCSTCNTCMSNYNSPSSPAYHDKVKLQDCLNCPCT